MQSCPITNQLNRSRFIRHDWNRIIRRLALRCRQVAGVLVAGLGRVHIRDCPVQHGLNPIEWNSEAARYRM
jgi:hypothetical protein